MSLLQVPVPTEKADDIQEEDYKKLQKYCEELKTALDSDDKGKEILRLQEEISRLKNEVDILKKRCRKQEHLLYSMGSDQAKKKGGKKAAAFTMKRNAVKQEEVRVLTDEVIRWINRVLELEHPMTTKSVWFDLSTGVILCDLLLKIKPDLVLGKIHRKAGPASFWARDNVKYFLKGCEDLEVKEHDLFSITDLLSTNSRNPRAVIGCLLSLARVAANYGIDPPDIIKLEKEIEKTKAEAAQRLAQGRPSVAEEEDEIDKVVTVYCKTKHLPKPERISKGEYKFGQNVTASVRVLRGNAVVRYEDRWEEFAPFLLSKMKEEVLGVTDEKASSDLESSPSKSIILSLPSTPTSPSQEEKKLQFEVTSPTQAEPSDDSQTLKQEITIEGTPRKVPPSPSMSQHSDDGEEKMVSSDPLLVSLGPLTRGQRDVEAKKEFFYLTALSVKLKHDLREDVVVVNTHELFARAVQEEIQFYNFGDWCHNELTKSYLAASRQNRLDNLGASGVSPVNLRGQRKVVMTSLFNRKQTQDKRDRGEL